MARLRIYHDTRTALKDGRSQVKISLSHRGTTALFPTDILVKPEHWHAGNEETEPHIKRTCAGYKALNSLIEAKYERINDMIVGLAKQNSIQSFKSATQLKQYIQGKIDGEGPVSFTDYFRTVIASKENKQTRTLYEVTYKKIVEFSKGRQLRFEDITPMWLSEFDKFMGKLAVNARAINMRNVRAVINSAMNNEVTNVAYSFRKFKIRTEETPKRSAAAESIANLRDFECEERQRQYVDIFLLIFYLRGINIIDLCNLKEIENGRIEFHRAKTGKFYSIKVEPEALEIINRYRGENYLLNILDRYKDYKNYLFRLNRNLKQIGPTKMGRYNVKDRQPLLPKLSTYWARHSWATIAAELDIPKETIAAGLGHGGNDITDTYIDFDQRKVDSANRRIIDFLNEK